MLRRIADSIKLTQVPPERETALIIHSVAKDGKTMNNPTAKTAANSTDMVSELSEGFSSSGDAISADSSNMPIPKDNDSHNESIPRTIGRRVKLFL